MSAPCPDRRGVSSPNQPNRHTKQGVKIMSEDSEDKKIPTAHTSSRWIPQILGDPDYAVFFSLMAVALVALAIYRCWG